MSTSLPRRGYGFLLSVLSVLLVVPRAGAQPPPAQDGTTNPAPEDDPRRGPRLEYTRGPAECLPEEEFRSEVAIATRDGIDHLHDSSPDAVRVWFEKVPRGFRGTVVYTDATGAKDPPQVHTSDHCGQLARWVASTVSSTIPLPPPPTCPPAHLPPAPVFPCSPCPVCATPRPVSVPTPPQPPPWRMDLSVGLSAYVMMTAFLTADVGPAVGVAGSVGGEVFSVNAEFRFALPGRTYALEPVPGTSSNRPAEFDLSQLTALIVPCARYKYFVGCGVAQFGWLIMKSPITQDAIGSYGFGPRLGFEVPFAERFAAFGFGEVLFSPDPIGIQFTLPVPGEPDTPPQNTRWRQSVASAFFGAGLSMKFR